MGSHARQNENAGADDRPDAQSRQLHWSKDAAQAVLAFHLVQEHRERFGSEKLISHQLASVGLRRAVFNPYPIVGKTRAQTEVYATSVFAFRLRGLFGN